MVDGLVSVIRLLRKKGTHAKPKGAKKSRAEARLLGIREYPNSSGFYANIVDPLERTT